MRLTDAAAGKSLRVGTALRLSHFGPAMVPTLLMICSRSTQESDLALIVVGGHKRGLTLLLFPQLSYSSDFGISREWLVENWNYWIDSESHPEDVEVIPDLTYYDSDLMSEP
jgi:Immunity protein 45